MKKIMLFLFLLAFGNKAFCQNAELDKINSFLAQAIEEIKIKNNYEPSNIFLQDAADFSLFNESLENKERMENEKNVIPNCHFVAEQIRANKDFKFQSTNFKNISVISFNTISSIFSSKDDYTLAWKKLNATFNLTQGFISCSVPFFYDNDTKALFSYGIHCGPFCEKKTIAIFEKIDGTWRQSKNIDPCLKK